MNSKHMKLLVLLFLLIGMRYIFSSGLNVWCQDSIGIKIKRDETIVNPILTKDNIPRDSNIINDHVFALSKEANIIPHIGDLSDEGLFHSDNIVQPSDKSLTIVGTSTLCRATEVIQQMYRKPVTCEQPTGILQWDGDVDQEMLSDGKIVRIPKQVEFVMPDTVKPDKNQQFDTSILEKVVEAYRVQFDGPKYRIVKSKWGLHLIADEVRNKNGQFIKEKPYLDEIISVPPGKRTGSAHIKKIVDSINASKGTTLQPPYHNPPDDLYWQNGDVQEVPNINEILWGFDVSEENRLLYEEKVTFEWKADKVVARDALIDLLEKANTTLTWQLTCSDHIDSTTNCRLGIFPLELVYLMPNGLLFQKALYYDRLTPDQMKSLK